MIYLAGPFFNKDQIHYIEQVEQILRDQNYEVFSPREHFIENGDSLPNHIWGQKVFEMDVKALEDSDFVVAVYHGMYSDTGTAWELGYAYAKNIPIILVCTDFKIDQSVMVVNASKSVIISLDELSNFDIKTFDNKHIVNTQK